MAGACSKDSCFPDETGCNIEGHKILENCQFYGKDSERSQEEKNDDKDKFINLPWTGNTFGLNDLNFLTAHSDVSTIGVTGVANAGKTTFLATFYCLLRNGMQIDGYKFAGSLTLVGWENISWYLSWDNKNYVQYPPHTSIKSGRVPGLLHISLRNSQNGHIKDLIFTDAPGEWFDEWSYNRYGTNAQGAEWIYNYADAFLLFSDCEKLSSKKRGKARRESKLLADRLNENLHNRPLGLIWSKSDINISDSIKEQISSHIKQKRPKNYREFETSVEEGESGEFHENILKSINWFLRVLGESNSIDLEVDVETTNDPFLLKGRVK